MYTVRYFARAESQKHTLPFEGQRALAELESLLASDPYSAGHQAKHGE